MTAGPTRPHLHALEGHDSSHTLTSALCPLSAGGDDASIVDKKVLLSGPGEVG
jgi:hypothetical protein